jgi:cytochrome c peroxidase
MLRNEALFSSSEKPVVCNACGRRPFQRIIQRFPNARGGNSTDRPEILSGLGDVPFRNAGGEFSENGNQDFGLFDITEENQDIYKFRTSPLRNLAIQPAFFHNGVFTSLSEALHHHLDAVELGPQYDPVRAGVASHLTHNTGPIAPVIRL